MNRGLVLVPSGYSLPCIRTLMVTTVVRASRGVRGAKLSVNTNPHFGRHLSPNILGFGAPSKSTLKENAFILCLFC